MSTDMEAARAVLKKHWGHDKFRPAQEVAIQAVLDGKDILAVLSTGYGKSTIFQIPALMKPGCALVISPLISLMKDQCDDCATRGIPASYVNSSLGIDEQRERFGDLITGAFKVFYVAPERLSSQHLRNAVSSADISYLVVDECHAVSRLGHSFRPAYMRIKDVLQFMVNRPVTIAVTATATHDIETDIATGINLRPGYVRIIGDPIRPNLSYRVLHGNSFSNLDRLIPGLDVKNGRHLIYSATRGGAEKAAEKVQKALGEKVCAFYHAGMTSPLRTKVQDDFKSGKTPIIVATCAFGMGIDVPNIRTVIHLGIPGSVEDLMQEIGRAGRDGKFSDTVLLHDDFAIKMRRDFLDWENPPYPRYEEVWKWLHTRLEPGDALSMSGEDIAESMNHDGALGITGQCVLGVLSNMEAYNAVLRGCATEGTVLHVKVKQFDSFCRSCEGSPALRTVANYLWDQFVEPEIPAEKEKQPEIFEFCIAKHTVARLLHQNEVVLSRYLKLLSDKEILTVVPAFHGKTTRIGYGHYGKPLSSIVPRENIEVKRRRELIRLDRMLGYCHTDNRIGYIREYFLGEGGCK